MKGLYKNKYRTKSTRLPAWDYSWDGYYFVTICVKDRRCLFGNIENNKMILNELGKIAVEYWLQIPRHFNNIVLDEFIVMSNHIHGIIIIKNKRDKNVETQHCCVSTSDISTPETCPTPETQQCCVSTTNNNIEII